MKVLLVNSTCKVGGVSTFMLSLRRALVGQGHQCELFFFGGGSMQPLLPRQCPSHFGSLSDCLRLVARQRIDVVHANNVDWPKGVSAVRELGARLVLTAHKVREHDLTYGWMSTTCDAMTTVSEWIRRELQPFTDVPIAAVPNGIDVHRFCPDPRPTQDPSPTIHHPIVAWIGRGGSPWKRLEKLATMAPALHAAGLRLWIVDQHGPDTVRAVLPDAVETLAPRAERWGAVPYDEMPDLYRQVAASGGCVLSTSEREGLPLTLLEAQACGCPVAATRVRGNDECVFSAHGGLLFPYETAPADAAALVIDMLRDRAAMQRRRTEAAAFVRQAFSVERMAARYVEIYRSAPSQAASGVFTRMRARMRLSPVLHWREYLDHRWSVGREQFASSQELARRGEWGLAARAARASLSTSPTLYAKPHRLAHLLKAHLRG
jgi:glycosyltransferase involved in cell wall biosynthesis